MFDYFDSICILIMPTDSCNMNCKYCYHESHFKSSAGMSDELLFHLFKISIPFYKRIHFIWHGGEPLLMGLPFFEKVVNYEKDINIDGYCKITNGIQSNLTLMTSEFASFFKNNNFHIGTSFDGTCNEFTRGNTKKILNGRNIVVEEGIKCGCIMVVSKYNINSLIDSYYYYNDLDINYKISRFINSDNSAISKSMELDPVLFAEKMNELFDEWVNNPLNRISINPFKSIIEYILYGIKRECCHTSCLGKWLGVRHDGLVTNCNRYYYSKYEYGNISDYSNIREAFDSVGFKIALDESIERRYKCMSECNIYDYCSGGCNNVAMFEGGMNNNKGAGCISQQLIYYHIKEQIELLLSDRDFYNLHINPVVYGYLSKYKDNMRKKKEK